MPQHPSMIYRVHGQRGDESTSFVDVECGSEAVARNVAIRNGLVNTTGVEIVSRDIAVNPVRPVKSASSSGQRIVTEHSLPPMEAFKIGIFFTFGVAAALLVVAIGQRVLEGLFGIAF